MASSSHAPDVQPSKQAGGVLGRISLFLCPLSLALMGFAVKLSAGFTTELILLARFAFSALIYLLVLQWRGFDFRSIRPARHILRSVLGLASVSCLFGSISLIPLSTALCLSYMVPVFTYGISVYTGAARLDHRAALILGALVGVALIVQPEASVDPLGAALGICSALCGALALFEIKRLSQCESPDAVLVMYFLYSTGILACVVLVLDSWPLAAEFALINTSGLIAVGILGLLYQLFLLTALRQATVATMSMALLVAVALGYGIDTLLLGAALSPLAVWGTTLLAISLMGYHRASR